MPNDFLLYSGTVLPVATYYGTRSTNYEIRPAPEAPPQPGHHDVSLHISVFHFLILHPLVAKICK
jgi:hypothetical protein